MTTGSCLCGAVKFKVSEFCSEIYKCHCSKCRKAFGGASSAAALADDDNFSWLQGSELARQYQSESGYKTYFCGSCGSVLPQHIPDHNLYWVPAGLLDSDPGISLTKHIYVNSKATWEILDQYTEHLEEGFEQ